MRFMIVVLITYNLPVAYLGLISKRAMRSRQSIRFVDIGGLVTFETDIAFCTIRFSKNGISFDLGDYLLPGLIHQFSGHFAWIPSLVYFYSSEVKIRK